VNNLPARIKFLPFPDNRTWVVVHCGLSVATFCFRVDAMAAPLQEKGVELERTLGYFQFNRDVDDEEVKTSHIVLHDVFWSKSTWLKRKS